MSHLAGEKRLLLNVQIILTKTFWTVNLLVEDDTTSHTVSVHLLLAFTRLDPLLAALHISQVGTFLVLALHCCHVSFHLC